MNLNDIGREAFATAHSKGFYNTTPTVPERLCLVHSEVSEADEAFRKSEFSLFILPSGKPVGLPSELADIIIRVADAATWLEVDLDKAVKQTRLQTLTAHGSQGFDRLCLIHSSISRTLEFFRDGENDLLGQKGEWRGVPAGLGEIVNHTFDMAFVMGIDLADAIHVKMAFNKTRPHKHGRKVL